LAHLKADREKKKQQAERLQQSQQQAKKLRTEDVFSSTSSSGGEQSDATGDGGGGDERKRQKKKRDNNKSSKKVIASSSSSSAKKTAATTATAKSSSDSNDESDDSSQSGSGSGSASDSAASGTSDDEEQEDVNLKKAITCKEDLNQVKMSRFKIEKWCHAPFFKSVAQGCFVRIGIGLNQNVNIYRVAEVIDVVETAKVYSIGTTKTNKGFKLKHGEDQRTYRLEFISNQAFTDEEFNRWKDVMNKHNLALPTRRDITAKRKQLDTFNEYRFQEQDIDFIVAEKKRFAKESDTSMGGGANKKMTLLVRREAAKQHGDLDLVKEIDEEISGIDSKAVDQIDKRCGSFSKLAAINARNREESNARVEDAMRKEYKRIQETGEDDPFQRRKGFPSIMNGGVKKKPIEKKEDDDDDDEEAKKAKQKAAAQKQQQQQQQPKQVEYEDFLAPSLVSRTTAAAAAAAAVADDGGARATSSESLNSSIFKNMLPGTLTPLFGLHLHDDENGNGNKLVAKKGHDDLFDDHNFEINIDLAVPISANPLQPVNTGSLLNSGLSRRSLNLDEYKRKKGLI
jgi:RNA polymerase-associated protein RTF1